MSPSSTSQQVLEAMFSFIPTPLLLPMHLLLQLINLSIWALLVIFLGLVRFLLPFAWISRLVTPAMHAFMACFGVVSVGLIKLTNKVEWDYKIQGTLSSQGWYLMMPNHLSWLDIILLIEFAAGRIPAPKFFLKKELLWMPFVGLGAWALDMPFMQRYSQEFIKKYPHLKGKDIETTRKFCERFKHSPTTVINFVEGSRFTPQKHAQRNSRYNHLLPPKAGGVAFTLATMGELFSNILDVTILYPNNSEHPMKDMLSGKLNHVVIHVHVLPVEEAVIGDYFNDDNFRASFQQWLNGLWLRKDKLIAHIIGNK